MSDKLITLAKILCVIVGISFFTNAGCYFSFPALDDVVFVGDAGVTVTDDISRALALLLSGWRLVSLCLRYCMGWQNWSLR
ncbi:hypothetical protein KSR88_001629 [Escherichia coli]|nr:hypothetical protein [Escherichia coli]